MKKLIIAIISIFSIIGCGDYAPIDGDAGSPTFPNRDSAVVRRDSGLVINSNDTNDANHTNNTNNTNDSGIDCDAYACPGTLRVLWTNEICSSVDNFSILYGLETINIPCNRLGFVTQITPSNMSVSIGLFYNGVETGRINQNVMIRANEVVTINIP